MKKGFIGKVSRLVYLILVWLLFLVPEIILGTVRFIEGFFRVLRKTLQALVSEGRKEMVEF